MCSDGGVAQIEHSFHNYSKQEVYKVYKMLPWPRLVMLMLLPPKPKAIPRPRGAMSSMTLQLVEVTVASLEVLGREMEVFESAQLLY